MSFRDFDTLIKLLPKMKTTERVSPDDTIKTLFRTLSQQKTKMYALYIPTSAASKNTMHPSVETKYVC